MKGAPPSKRKWHIAQTMNTNFELVRRETKRKGWNNYKEWRERHYLKESDFVLKPWKRNSNWKGEQKVKIEVVLKNGKNASAILVMLWLFFLYNLPLQRIMISTQQ